MSPNPTRSKPGSIPSNLIDVIITAPLRLRHWAFQIWCWRYYAKASREALHEVGLLILGSVSLAMATPGIGVWWLAWVGMIPLFKALERSNGLVHACQQGFLWGGLYHALIFLWFFGLHPLDWFGLPGLASFFGTLFGWVLAWGSQGLIVSVFWMTAYQIRQLRWGQPWVGYALIPLFWLLLYERLNQNPIGLPWGYLTYTQANQTWLMDSVYWLKLEGFEAMIILHNMIGAAILAKSVAFKHHWKTGFSLLCVIWLGLAGLHLAIPSPSPTILSRIAPYILQGNLSIETERSWKGVTQKLNRYRTLIKAVTLDWQRQVAKTHQHKPLVLVMPEGVLGVDKRSSRPGRSFDAPMGFEPVSSDVTLITGGLLSTESDTYNSLLVWQGNHPIQALYKRRLVAFGEATPFIPESWIQVLLKPFSVNYQTGFSTGPLTQPALKITGVGSIGGYICFEAGELPIRSVNQKQHPDLLITVANLGWFHRHRWLEKQFLAINQLRAVEAATPLILSTNTGESAIIDSRGRVVSQPILPNYPGVYGLFHESPHT